MSTFDLLGHDCPLGRYPAPVVPVGRHEGRLVTAYSGQTGVELVPIEEGALFERHSAELSAKLGPFDPTAEHLFAHDAANIDKYAETDEKSFLLRLLARDDFSRDNPFMRLTLAEATKDPAAILPEMKRCLEAVPADNAKLRDVWYTKQRAELASEIPGAEGLLPETWQELAGLTKDRVYDISTFKSEAPELPKLVKALFCSRDKELARALEVLRANLDVSGRCAETHDKRPWLIHGDSRSGKSHLARRLLLELPTERRVQVVLAVREKQDAVLAMRMLLDKLIETYGRLSAAGRNDASRAVPDLEPLLGAHPSVGRVASACGQMAQLLEKDHGIEHLLILFDDVDLLEGYADRERNGRLQRAALSAAVAELVKVPGIDVILTARSWYTETVRECEELVELERMTEDELVAVYEKQLSVFAPLRPRNFLSSDAVRKAIEDADGLPGLFLRHLHIVLNEYRRDADWRVREYDWCIDVLRRYYGKLSTRFADAARRLEDEVAEGRSSINVESGNVFRNMAFENVLVFQSYYSEYTLGIAPLAKKIIPPRRAA